MSNSIQIVDIKTIRPTSQKMLKLYVLIFVAVIGLILANENINRLWLLCPLALLLPVSADYFRGTLTQMQKQNDELQLYFESKFFNKQQIKTLQLAEIQRLDYDNFYQRISIITTTRKHHMNTFGADKADMQSFVDKINGLSR